MFNADELRFLFNSPAFLLVMRVEIRLVGVAVLSFHNRVVKDRRSSPVIREFGCGVEAKCEARRPPSVSAFDGSWGCNHLIVPIFYGLSPVLLLNNRQELVAFKRY